MIHHWTATSEKFQQDLAVQFLEQAMEVMDATGVNRSELARRLDCTEPRVSRIFNQPANMTLLTMVRVARALGVKTAMVMYDDGDPDNLKGPVDARVFRDTWKLCAAPRTGWDLEECKARMSRPMPTHLQMSAGWSRGGRGEYLVQPTRLRAVAAPLESSAHDMDVQSFPREQRPSSFAGLSG